MLMLLFTFDTVNMLVFPVLGLVTKGALTLDNHIMIAP